MEGLSAARPCLGLLRRLWRQRDVLGAALLIAVCGCYVHAILLVSSDRYARFWLAHAHLRTSSFVTWALATPLPWMYSMEHRILVSDRALTWLQLASPPTGLEFRHLNHQPTRVFTFADGRAKHLHAAGTRYVYLDSSYRDQRLRTLYRVDVPTVPRLGAPAARVTRVTVAP